MNKLMRRILLLQPLVFLWLVGQTPISSIRVYTEPTGATFQVDGVNYVGPQTFLWPQGSKHVVLFPLVTLPDGTLTNYQQSADQNTRWTFSGWSDNQSLLNSAAPAQVITADPKVTFIKAATALQYRVALRFSNSPTAVPNCAAPGDPPQDGLRSGIAYLAGTCYGSNADLYLSAGTIPLVAFPYPGWVFTGWNTGGAIVSSYISSFNLIGPTTISPMFIQSKQVQFITNPAALQVLVDRSPTPTSDIYPNALTSPNAPCEPNMNLPPGGPKGFPALCYGEFDFIPGSQHVIGAVTPQADRSGKFWVFESFSNGMPQNSVYTVPSVPGTKDVITAKFLPGVQTLFTTIPAGLKLSVDGKESWQYYSFIWASGSTHTFSAAASQTDSKQRKWTFKNWSNDGPATQTVTVDQSRSSYQWIANYTALGQVKITTNPPGIKLVVDGVECVSPCLVDKDSGAQVAIRAPASIPQSETSRLDFTGWADNGGANVRDYTMSSDVTTLQANYSASYRILALSDPDNGVDLSFNPPSSDGFYPGDTALSITARARPGYKFRRWGGDAAGVYPVAQVQVAGPRAIVAMLDRIPYIAPAGIRNAAAATPDGAVAPGSIISIVGESLAPRTESGPTNPLAQTIADVVVTVNDRILPLLYVSPSQINAQVLSDLPDGDYSLKVRWTGMPDVSAGFTIARNAPGLFMRTEDGRPLSAANHEDGTPVTPDSPARRGETVSIFGTGFGPYNQKIIDGFVVPAQANYGLADPVELSAGDQNLRPMWTGAAAGLVGTAVTKLKIDEALPNSTNIELMVNVNGKRSNKVLLPIE